MKANTFPCTTCGLCCKNINGIKALEHFNHNGICINLNTDNTCKIYNTRPLVCRVDEMYEKFYSHISKRDFYNENIKICNILQEKANLDKKYRIKLINLGGEIP